MAALLAVTDRAGIVINKVNLAKHALYEYGDYYSRYNAYYGAKAQSAAAAKPAADDSGIARLKRIVPRVK